MLSIKETTIESNQTSSPVAALISHNDAVNRSCSAIVDNPDFFDTDHLARVNQVRNLVDKFFSVRRDIYVNHRVNRGKPFSVVKVLGATWPANKNKQRDLYEPLSNLGVTEIILSKKSNSYLFRIR
jgi:hypothetical protein